jgi:hypothetical protein
MFTRKGEKTTFDSISLVELRGQQSPIDGGLKMEATLCYIDSVSGHTFGRIELTHDTQVGMEVLSPAAVKAWQAFCQQVERDQGHIIFGEGKAWDPNQKEMFSDDSQAESREGLQKGLGGGS